MERCRWLAVPAILLGIVVVWLVTAVLGGTPAKPAKPAAPPRRVVTPTLLIRGRTEARVVALTIDDGPHPYTTPLLLAQLRRLGVPATFFLVGRQAALYPELVRQIVADGHAVGNHTMHHRSLPGLPPAQIAEEIAACNRTLYDITGELPRYLRPPGGQCDETVVRLAAAQGCAVALWTGAAKDYERPGDAAIADRLLQHLRPGAILLAHDGIYQTADALPAVITRLRREGYRCVRLEEVGGEW